jgi:hypothetical protein
MSLLLIEESAAARVIDDHPVNDDIHVVLQYFEHANPLRDNELKLTLRLLCEHPLITTVHLLNERIYSGAALDHPKIRQCDVGGRLKFKDVFQYLREHQVLGYHVIINSDICFDETLANLRRSDLHVAKKMMAQLRYEVLDPAEKFVTEACPLFGPRIDSQDTWIFHSNQAIPERFEKVFNFHFGKPGCDNKMVYLMRMLGYTVINDPAFVKTYHIHASQDRSYTIKDRVPPPYGLIGPYGYNLTDTGACYLPPPSIIVDRRAFHDVDFDNCNDRLRTFILKQWEEQRHFVIPCISSVPHVNNFAVFGRLQRQNALSSISGGLEIQNYLDTLAPSFPPSFSDNYLAAFESCELFLGNASFDADMKHMYQSHDVVLKWFPTKQMIWSQALDIFHYIYKQPWTHALRGKRILVISTLDDDVLRQQVQRRQPLFDGIDLFPDCEFVFLQFSGSFFQHFSSTVATTSFDVALVACEAHSNAVCSAIYKSGRSAICVGDVLQMYFGVLGKTWLRDRPDVVRLFLNGAWKLT